MFAGIGGFREGLQLAGDFKCVGYCECDKYAQQSYRALFNCEEEWYSSDARKIEPDELPEFDLLCGGFPCQSFSIAGTRKGFGDPRGTLFFELARVAEARKPRYLLFENVPGLLNHNGGRTFAAILDTLERLGYFVEWQVLNSKDFGVPQSRRRVYIVGYLDERCRGKILPFTTANATPLACIHDGPQGSRVYDPSGVSCTLTSGAGGVGGKTGLYQVGFPIKEATRKGYKMAYPGDSIDLVFILIPISVIYIFINYALVRDRLKYILYVLIMLFLFSLVTDGKRQAFTEGDQIDFLNSSVFTLFNHHYEEHVVNRMVDVDGAFCDK